VQRALAPQLPDDTDVTPAAALFFATGALPEKWNRRW
jgi:hypothetical protein